MRVFTEEQNKWLEQNVPGHTARQTINAFNQKFHTNMTLTQIQSWRKNHHVPCGVKWNGDTNEEGYKIFPIGMEEYMREISPGRISDEITDLVNEHFGTNLKVSQIRSFKKRFKIRSGYDSRLKKGVKNACVFRVCDHPNSLRKRFEKGHVPVNKMKVGSERLVEGYVYIKVGEPNKWARKARLVWEETHGEKLTKDKIITYLDGNKQNLDPENLYAIPKNLHSTMNRKNRRSSDPEVTRSYIALTQMEKIIKEKKKNGNKS